MTRYIDIMTESDFSLGAGSTRLHPKSIDIGRSYLIDGLNIRETADKHGTTPENVRRIVSKIARCAGHNF